MGDGEQQKGQISEARRFAKKYAINNITAIVDFNHLQISGNTSDVMPQDIRASWESDGWEVLEIDGHDIRAIYSALRHSTHAAHPVCIMARTIMGKGVPEMENKAKYHGSPLGVDAHAAAMEALGLPNRLGYYQKIQPEMKAQVRHWKAPDLAPAIAPGAPRTYTLEKKTDNRSAFGNALADLGETNPDSPMAVFDCDLAVSVKTGAFAKGNSSRFFQAGIQEHHTASAAGAISTQGVLTFWADFGILNADEAYNQQRLNDINRTSLKTVATHCGLDVGEDGKTHHGIDYLGVMRNLYGYKVIIPADPNETDRVTRYVATHPGNFFVAVGRSKLDVITDEQGKPFFGGDYEFEYGKAVTLRRGNQLTVFATGTMTHRAVQAWDLLQKQGISIQVVHIPTPLSIDREVLETAAATGTIITYEDHHVGTGLGSLTAEALIAAGLCPKLIRMGVTGYQSSGNSASLFAQAGLDVDSLVRRVSETLAK
jgi:transketolase